MGEKTAMGASRAGGKQSSKVFAFMASLLLAAAFLGGGAQTAFAASDSASLAAGSIAVGTQGNNSFNRAKAISANTTITAMLDEYGPSNMGVRVYEDWYKVTLSKKGVFAVILNTSYVDKYFAADPWCMELRSSDNRKLWYGTRENRNGAKTMFTMGLPAGTYYICLYSSSVPRVAYGLRTFYAASSVWEVEPANDSMSKADTLTVGKTKFGTVYGCLDMGSNTDRDWFRLNIPTAGKYSLRFGAEYSSDAPNAWYLVDLYDSTGNWLWSKQCKGDGWVRTIVTFNMGAGTYHVKITGARYLDALHYELTMNKVKTKAANPLTVKGKTINVKYKTLKKKAQSFSKDRSFLVSSYKGTVTFTKVSGNKYLTVSKAGKVTVKKGLKKGTYKMKVKVTAAGNASYKAGSKTVTVVVKVK